MAADLEPGDRVTYAWSVDVAATAATVQEVNADRVLVRWDRPGRNVVGVMVTETWLARTSLVLL